MAYALAVDSSAEHGGEGRGAGAAYLSTNWFDTMIHVYPLNEEADHDLTDAGHACRCVPKVDWTLAECLVVHRSKDGREYIEEAERIVNGTGRDVEGTEDSCKA